MLTNVVGHSGLKKSIEVAYNAAKFRQETFGHFLISGSGGLGKTFIIDEICHLLGYRKKVTQGNHLPAKQVADFLIQCCSDSGPAFIFIDEIHELSLDAQEELYYAMDEGCILRDGHKVPLGPFTLAGATTQMERLDGKSLVKRFQYYWQLEPMRECDLVYLVNKFYLDNKITCSFDVLNSISQRSRGIPREAETIASRARDYANYEHRHNVTLKDVDRTFIELGLDAMGLDRDQQKYLKILYENDKPVGIDTLSMMILDESNPSKVKNIIEPYLRKLGLVASSSKGRELTEAGHKHIMQNWE